MSDWFNHVAAATTATDGPAGDGNIPTSAPGITSIDGVALEPGNRILLKNQTRPSENGTYTYEGSRSPLDSSGDALAPQAVVRVDRGTVNGYTEWWLKDPGQFWTKAWASTADSLYYVSSSIYADDGFDGLSHGTEHQTIAHALKTLGTNSGIIQLLGGSFNAPPGGLRLIQLLTPCKRIRGLISW
jgi:hypothetical protein